MVGGGCGNDQSCQQTSGGSGLSVEARQTLCGPRFEARGLDNVTDSLELRIRPRDDPDNPYDPTPGRPLCTSDQCGNPPCNEKRSLDLPWAENLESEFRSLNITGNYGHDSSNRPSRLVKRALEIVPACDVAAYIKRKETDPNIVSLLAQRSSNACTFSIAELQSSKRSC